MSKEKVEKLFKDSYVNYYKTQVQMSEDELIEEFELQKAVDEKRFEDMIELLTLFGEKYNSEMYPETLSDSQSKIYGTEEQNYEDEVTG